MKKQILTASMVALVAASSFGQGQFLFKTTTTKNPVYASTDGTQANLATITSPTLGAFGPVSFELLMAPAGTAALTSITPGVTPAGWDAVALGAYTVGQPGVINTVTVTVGAGDGGAASTFSLAIVAFTGTYQNPTLFGYSGEVFPNAAAGLTAPATANGLVSWQQAIASASGTPPGVAQALSVGTAGLGSIVLVPVPEPSTIALGGLCAAGLLAFRRRK